jgi:hypothetical protein
MISDKARRMFSIAGLLTMAFFCISLKTDEKKFIDLLVEQKDKTNIGLRKTVRHLSKIREGIVLDYQWNELSVALAMVTEDYTMHGIAALEYPAVKKIKNYKSISHVLIMLSVENYDKKGCLHYGFVYKDEDIYEAAKKILTGDHRSFRIDLSPANDKYEWLSVTRSPRPVLKNGKWEFEVLSQEQRSLRWLSESSYKLQLNAPRGGLVGSSGYCGGNLMIDTSQSVISFEIGFIHFGIPSPGSGMQPNQLATALLDFAMADFQIRKTGEARHRRSPG